jgi:anti-anti-sigma factor
MSAHDIPAGTPWGTALHEQLRCTDFGVLCLTPENLRAPWILYEAGALAMSSKVGCVVPFLLDVGPEKLPAPLAQFQSVPANKEGTWKVVSSIQSAQDSGLAEEALWQVFERAWPTLAGSLGLGIRTDLRGHVLVVTPSAMQMDRDEEVQGLGERMKALVHRGHKKVVLDLAEISTTTSMGMSLIIRASTFWKRETEVVLANVQPGVLQAFETTQLLGHIKHFPTLDQALAYLDRPKGPTEG